MKIYLDTNYSNSLYTSTVCAQELIHLCQIGKIRIGKKCDVIQQPSDVFSLLEQMDVKLVPITEKHLQAYATLSLWKEHSDPNDRLIIAQAISDRVCLVSSDHKFKHYEQYGLNFLFNKR